MPSNTTPETASEIVSLPFTETIADWDAAPNGTGYAATCNANQYNALWWKYTTGADENLIVLGAETGVYSPELSIWTGIPPALTQLTLTDQNFCEIVGGGFGYAVPVEPSTTYYFQINGNSAVATSDFVEFIANAGPSQAKSVGQLLIPDDTYGFRAIAISPVTAAAIWTLDFPPGEYGCFSQNGYFLVADETNSNANFGRAVLYGPLPTMTEIASVDYSPRQIRGITCDRHPTDPHFYVFEGDASGRTVHKIDLTGAEVASWDLSADFVGNAVGSIAVNRDATIFYYWRNALNTAGRQWDLVNDIQLADLHAGYPTERAVGAGDGVVDDDGNIWFVFGTTLNGSNPYLRSFNPAGTQLQNINLKTAPTSLNRCNHYGYDPSTNSIWIWGIGVSTDEAYWQQFDASTGTKLQEIGPTYIHDPSGTAGPNYEVGISNSCPLLIVALSLVGTLIVQKSLFSGSEDTDFDIQIGGGLSPSSLTLKGGESHQYDDVPVGSGYSVTEPSLPLGYTNTGILTSNGSPSGNITVADGEIVTVTVFNSLTPSPATPVSACQVSGCEPQRGGPRQGV